MNQFIVIVAMALVVTTQANANVLKCIRQFFAPQIVATQSPSLRQDFPSQLVQDGLSYLKSNGIEPQAGFGRPESWSVDGPNSGLDSDFNMLGNKLGYRLNYTRFFDVVIADMKSAGQSTHTLEIMGSGFFASGRGVDSITGLRWGPWRPHAETPDEARFVAPPEVLGDAFNSQTWSNLDQSLAERGIEKLDLVVMRPFGGWSGQPWSANKKVNLAALKVMLGNVISRLSPHGRFYFSLDLNQLPGDLATDPALIELQQLIEASTNYRLVIQASVAMGNTTYDLAGALIPK